MDLIGLVLLGVALVLAVLVFRLCLTLGWHWSAGLLLGTIPLAATFFFGIIGLLGSALAVGGLYKAAAR
jgi:hypothetical protein